MQVAHPLRVRACSYEAKTDALDARVLARDGPVCPASAPCPSESEEEREELPQRLRRRRQRVDQRIPERNRLDKGVSAAVGRSTRRHITWLDQEIARLDQAYQALLQRSAALRSQATRYRSVPGVGSLTTVMLVAFLPELGQRDSKALTSLVGLAPWSRDSGHKRGQRSIRGGRAAVRHALYMAALSVIRQEGIHQHFHRGLRQRGKTGKVALVVVMRKLLLHLNAVARRGPPGCHRGSGNLNLQCLDIEHRYCVESRVSPAMGMRWGCQGTWSRTMALRMRSSLRMAATSATLQGVTTRLTNGLGSPNPGIFAVCHTPPQSPAIAGDCGCWLTY